MRFPLLLALLLMASGPAFADGSAVAISNAWARATPGQTTIGAAYLSATSPAGDRLVGAESPVAGMIQIHQHTMDGGVMRMRQVDGIDLPAGQAVTLEPGGYHLMLMDLRQKLVEGQSFPLTLVFKNAGKETIEVRIESAGAAGPMPGMGGMGGMGGMAQPAGK
jgi:copper(I)-binding protein